MMISPIRRIVAPAANTLNWCGLTEGTGWGFGELGGGSIVFRRVERGGDFRCNGIAAGSTPWHICRQDIGIEQRTEDQRLPHTEITNRSLCAPLLAATIKMPS